MKLNFNQAFEQALNKPENIGVKKYMESYPFEISQKILAKRISLKLSPLEAAHKVGISIQDYRAFENAIKLQASEEEYYNVLNKLSHSEAQVHQYTFLPFNDKYSYESQSCSEPINVFTVAEATLTYIPNKINLFTKSRKKNETNIQGLFNQENKLYAGKFANV